MLISAWYLHGLTFQIQNNRLIDIPKEYLFQNVPECIQTLEYSLFLNAL